MTTEYKKINKFYGGASEKEGRKWNKLLQRFNFSAPTSMALFPLSFHSHRENPAAR